MNMNETLNANGFVDTYLEKQNEFWKIKFIFRFRWPI